MTYRFIKHWERFQRLPLMMCGMRPFFMLAAISASLFLVIWLLALSGLLGLDSWLYAMPGTATAWHAQEMLFGFALAAVAGFLLVAVPEFTQSPPFSVVQVSLVLGAWLVARIFAVLAPLFALPIAVFGLWAANGMVSLSLLIVVWPRVLTNAGKPHRSFAYALLVLFVLQSGFFLSLWQGRHSLPWLYAAVGALMVLILVAASRISMRIMNSRIEKGVLHPAHPEAPLYLARPPRRNLAIAAIAACTGLEFFNAPATVKGWVALAAMAAILNVLNDWHVGRPLYNRWAWMLYACYCLLAGGYLLLGLSWLGAPWGLSAGRHMLMVGAMGLSVFVVMAISGRQHCGVWLDTRRWVPLAAGMLVLSAMLRAWSALPYTHYAWYWMLGAGGLWVSAYGLFIWRMAPVLVRARADGQFGCAEPEGAHGHHPGAGCG